MAHEALTLYPPFCPGMEEGELSLPEISPEEKGVRAVLCQVWDPSALEE